MSSSSPTLGLKTNFYIDSFNLYNRAVKDTAYKWLDLLKVCQRLAPNHSIHRIGYFTARIHDRQGKTCKASNDSRFTYVHLRPSQFWKCSTDNSSARINTGHSCTQSKGLSEFVWIKGTEEKGTNVNLATYLIADGYRKDYEQAFVISNDSNLALPIAIVRDEFEIPIAVVNPNLDPTMRTHEKLSDAATFEQPLREVTLGECQFPPPLQDAQARTITKPPS